MGGNFRIDLARWGPNPDGADAGQFFDDLSGAFNFEVQILD